MRISHFVWYFKDMIKKHNHWLKPLITQYIYAVQLCEIPFKLFKMSSSPHSHPTSFLPTCPKCTVIGLWLSKARSGPSLLTEPVEEVKPAVLSSSMTAGPAVGKPFSACSCRGGTQGGGGWHGRKEWWHCRGMGRGREAARCGWGGGVQSR